MKVVSVESIPDAAILHHVDPAGGLYATQGRAVLKADQGESWERLAVFPPAFPRDLFGFSRPSARAMRADKANIFVNTNGRLLAIRAGVAYALGQSGVLEPLFDIRGDSVLHGGICEDPEGWTCFGEYYMNPGRGEVRIFRVDPQLRTWEVAYTFPPGEIRHVHGVYRDPFDPRALWVTSGDATGECYLYRSRDRFATLERLGDGTQHWRAVRLFFTEDAVCWITDSQVEQNFSCRLERSTQQMTLGQGFDAPAWYGSTTVEGLHLAFTTVEPGPAVQRNTAGIYASRDAFRWEEIYSIAKDAWRPMKLFKYGVISCPSGLMSQERFFISGEGLKHLDGASARIRIEDDPG